MVKNHRTRQIKLRIEKKVGRHWWMFPIVFCLNKSIQAWDSNYYSRPTYLDFILEKEGIGNLMPLWCKNSTRMLFYFQQFFQVYQEFQIQLTDLTVENLLEQFTLAKHTGLEKPGKIWYGTLLLKFSIFPVRILILWHRFQNSVHQ